jgi:hypothetical protein
MEHVAQGGSITLTAFYENGVGTRVDPVDPTITISDPDGTVVVDAVTPSRSSVGSYSYRFAVASDATIGAWQAHWTGTIEGLASETDDYFDVVTAGSIVTAPSPLLDLLTLDEAKAALNIAPSNTDFDAELGAYVSAISDRIDDYCGPVVKRPIAGEAHDGGDGFVFLDVTPVVSVGQVVEWSNGAGTVLAAETLSVAGDYVLIDGPTHNAKLLRRGGWSGRWFATGRANVVVDYIAGRFDSTAAVSPKFKQAAAKTLSWLWKGDQGAGSATFGAPAEGTSLFGLGFALPNVVVELLAYERKPPVLA